ncbi:acyltransferase [Halomonas desiderata]|uniref:acyltransferase n=1 Tax=Billgrantia desiderata TaxID=52021 RepID=UPI000A374741|nr:acyltransferase [Halomonas desiderata]NIC38806.1 acyltransferase [Halomonas desiderata]OUE44875.1 O-acetyltransferase [Halomonas desiderata SP1]
MAYLSHAELMGMGFKKIGNGVKISDKASIYEPEKISIDDYSRIDDFCVISGRVEIGKYCHITPMCLVAGGEPGVYLADFSTLAYGVKIFSQSDDYSGRTMVNSLVPKKYKDEIFKKVEIGRQVVIGANTVVLPGVIVAEGCAIGASALVLQSTRPWGMYVGIPARRIKERSKALLDLEKKFVNEVRDDSI